MLEADGMSKDEGGVTRGKVGTDGMRGAESRTVKGESPALVHGKAVGGRMIRNRAFLSRLTPESRLVFQLSTCRFQPPAHRLAGRRTTWRESCSLACCDPADC
jgi:hypothetical protein